MTDQLPANPMADFAKRAQVHRQPQTRESGFLKFNGKTGEWTLGQEEIPVKGEPVLIAAPTMMHGFVRWGEIPPAQDFTSVADPLPPKPEPIDGIDQNTGKETTFYAKPARKIAGKFMDEELGQFVYNTDSMGGVERMDELFDKIIDKSKASEFCFPLVELDCDFYKRATGKVFKPVFKILAWCDMNGQTEGKVKKIDKPAEVDDTEEDEPVVRRRRKLAD